MLIKAAGYPRDEYETMCEDGSFSYSVFDEWVLSTLFNRFIKLFQEKDRPWRGGPWR
jgi:hypothetical protein